MACPFFQDTAALLSSVELAIQLGVDTAQGQPFLVGAAFDEAALVQDQHKVGVSDGAQAVVLVWPVSSYNRYH